MATGPAKFATGQYPGAREVLSGGDEDERRQYAIRGARASAGSSATRG